MRPHDVTSPSGDQEPRNFDQIKSTLKDFLLNNAHSTIEPHPFDESKSPVIAKPWGEPALVIRLDGIPQQLIECLNNVILPERFSALWHTDTRRLEFIYTSFPDPETNDRFFQFTDDGNTYTCEFAQSSDRLIALSDSFEMIGPSITEYRNLVSILNPSKAPEGVSVERPISFWINDIDWNEDLILTLCRKLNFYLKYYDNDSPLILIHSPNSERKPSGNTNRYAHGSFPKSIKACPLDDTMLAFWQASLVGDSARRFLYSYQMIEYSAYYYLDDEVKRTVRRAISRPHALHEIDNVVSDVIEAVSSFKQNDIQKIENLIRNIVSPRPVWRSIEADMDFFSEKTEFEGGYVAPSIARRDWKAADFETGWVPTLSSALRGIRNALSHGREQRMSQVIMPTTQNLSLLRHWVRPIAVVANEIMLYHEVL